MTPRVHLLRPRGLDPARDGTACRTERTDAMPVTREPDQVTCRVCRRSVWYKRVIASAAAAVTK